MSIRRALSINYGSLRYHLPIKPSQTVCTPSEIIERVVSEPQSRLICQVWPKINVVFVPS